MNQEVSRTIREYFKTQPVEKAWVFGSFSRGEERADCDVDILITLIPGTRMGLKFFAMNIELEKLLNRPWVREPSPDPPRGDRYLSHSSRHTQVPVPATTKQAPIPKCLSP